MRRTEEHISILPACYHYDNVNTPYRSSRTTTSHAKIFSPVQPYLYSVCYNQGCLCRSLQRLQEGQEKLPSHRKKPWPEPGSYERTPPADEQRRRRWDREGEEDRRRRGTDTSDDLYLGSQDCAVKGAGRSFVQQVKLQCPQRGCDQSIIYNNKCNHTLQHNFRIHLYEFSPSTHSKLSFILHGFVFILLFKA